jgi:hypothetical protein
VETRPLGWRIAEAESTRRSEFEDMSDAELERSLDLSRTWHFLDRNTGRCCSPRHDVSLETAKLLRSRRAVSCLLRSREHQLEVGDELPKWPFAYVVHEAAPPSDFVLPYEDVSRDRMAFHRS